MSKPLFIGFAEVDITPRAEHGVFLDGYGFRTSPAEGLLNGIHARACVLQSGAEGEPFAILSLDVCGLGADVHDRLRRWIRLLTPLSNDRFALCATHTHAGPAAGVLAGLPVNMLYWDEVGKALGTLLNEAILKMEPGELRLSEGGPFTASANRRGKDSIDRRVPVCAAYNESGKLLGVLTSASCHAVSSNDMRISADYPGVMADLLEAKYAPATFLFLQGRGADINPTEEAMSAGESRPQKPGEVLADCVERGLAAPAQYVSRDGVIKSVTRQASLPYAYPDRAAIEKRLAELMTAYKDGVKPRSTEMDLLWHRGALDAVERGEGQTAVSVMLQMLSVGGLTFVFLPFEILTATGNAVEALLPAPSLVIGYANGTHGYLAPAAECGLGDYETCRSAHWYGMPECIPATEQALLAALAEMAKEL